MADHAKAVILNIDGIKTLQQAIIHFSDFENCKREMISLRWPDGVVRCPQCGSEHVTYLAKPALWKCYSRMYIANPLLAEAHHGPKMPCDRIGFGSAHRCHHTASMTWARTVSAPGFLILALREIGEIIGLGDDTEAQAQQVARLAAQEQQRAHTVAHKTAWDKGKPFPEDEAKWYMAQMVTLRAFYLEPFWERTEPEPYHPDLNSILKGQISYLESGACSRANRLRCKVGRRGPILAVYRKAVRSPVLLCYWCKRLTLPGERHVDHKQPLAAGGAHVAGNLCIACVECNLVKGDADPKAFRLTVAGKRTANGLIAADYFRWVEAKSE